MYLRGTPVLYPDLMKYQSENRQTSLARVCKPDRIVAFSRRLRFALAVVLPVVLIGCVHPPRSLHVVEGQEYLVVLPPVRLARHEDIQSFELEIRNGRVTAINRLLDDWSLEVEWDTPDRLLVRGLAGHFPAGLDSTADLSEMFAVRVDDRAGFRVAATLVTETATPADAPEVPSRSIPISSGEMTFRPRGARGLSR